MKHSVSGDSMTEVLEPKVVIPCPVNYQSFLQKLYIDLCNLIVESRIPRFNEKGYGDGLHCPPLLGRNVHGCDLSKSECQKHQRLVQHLLRAVGNNVFEIEVLVLPDCCNESKLKERIQNREYRLLEKWSLKCIYSKVQSTLVDVPQLLRAVRSFLHFSQLSAWLSSNKGKSPSNVYYWVKSSSDGLSTKFELEPEEHSFPICKISDDLYGSVKVKYPPRTQYIPIIPCSKHPPLHAYSFRTISDAPSLHQNVSLNTQVVRQLHKPPCDDQISVLSESGNAPESAPILLTPTILKTFTGNISDGNRVLKQPFCPDGLVDTSNLSFELKQSKNIDILPKSQTSYLCNYAETYNNGLSQENVCFDTSQLMRHFHKKRLKIRRINGDDLLSHANSTCLKSSEDNKFENQRKHALENVSLSTSTNAVSKKCETSPVNETYRHFLSEQKKRPGKRKVLNSNPEKSTVIPSKKACCDKYLSQGYQISLSCLNEIFPQQNGESSQDKCDASVISTSLNLNIANGYSISENRVGLRMQTLQPNVSNEADSRPSKCFSRSSKHSGAKNERANQNICRKDKLFTKFENIDDKKANFSSETRAYSATSVADSDYKNELKKAKLLNDCADNFSSLGSYCTNLTSSFDKPISNSDKSYVCRKLCLRNKRSELLKYQISPSSNCNFFPLDNLLDSEQSFSSLKTESKKVLFSQSNELQTTQSNENSNDNRSKSKLLAIRKEKNRRLEAKLLKRYNRIFAAKCRGSSSESSLANFKASNSDCKSCTRKHLNSSKYGLSEKKLHNLDKKIRKIKTSLKVLMEEAIDPSEKLEAKSLQPNLSTAENKSRRISKNIKYKSSKKQFKPNNVNTSFSSHPYNIINSSETVCAFECCQCQESRPKSQLSKLIAVTSTVPTTEFSQASSTLPSATKGKCSLQHKHKSENIWDQNEIPLQNDRQCPFVLNRLVPNNKRYQSCEKSIDDLERFPRGISSFPKGRKLLANFEESILKGCLPTLSSVDGFHAEIGASGSFFPNHLTLPANVSFYELGNSHQGTAPYVAHVVLGDAEYYLPKKGAVQVTLFNPSETVVKMFVLNYDFSSMPPLCHTFIRQKIYYLPVGSTEEHPSSPKWLRFIIHLRFASSKTGKIFLHKDFKIVVLNKSNDDAASEFNQEPRELRSFVSVPRNPTFSNF